MVVAIAGEIKAREEGLKGMIVIDERGNMGGEMVVVDGVERRVLVSFLAVAGFDGGCG